MMFDELIKSFKATMYERMSSPFLSSLILFFVYFNWKAILVIFLGSESIALRIKEIENTYTNANYNHVYPIICALVFSVVYPFVSLLFFGIQNFAVVLKRKLRDYIEKNTTIPVEKYLEIKTEVIKQKDAVNELLQTKDDEVQKLNVHIDQLSNSEAQLNRQVSLLQESLGEERQTFGEKYEVFNKQVPIIIEEIENQFRADVSRGIVGFWGNYGRQLVGDENINGGKLMDYDSSARFLQMWNEGIRMRVSKENYGGIITEYTSLLNGFVSLAEHIRLDIKKILESDYKNNSNLSHLTPETIREYWNQAREAANDTIDKWRRLLSECVASEEKNLSRPIINKISSIGDPASKKIDMKIAKAKIKETLE